MRGLQPGQTMKDLTEHAQHNSFRRRGDKRGGAPPGLKRLTFVRCPDIRLKPGASGTAMPSATATGDIRQAASAELSTGRILALPPPDREPSRLAAASRVGRA